jgi:putative ABC transport system permease protein
MRISFGENVQIALDSVWSHRFRAFLTIVGIVIGITTVVTVSSLLAGLRQGIVTFFQEFGPDNIFINRVSGDPSGATARPKELKRKQLRAEYAPVIKRLSPTVLEVSVQMFVPPVQGGRVMTAKVPGFETDNILITGASASSFITQPRELRAGRYFSEEEESRGAKVALIGSDIAEALFPEGDPTGRTFLADGAEFTAIGVFEKAKGGFFGQNGLDRQIMIPYATAELRYPQVQTIFLTARAKPGERDQAFDEVRQALRRIRNVPPGEDDDFSISTADQIVQSFDGITRVVGLVSFAISGLGLLVGGIGVMNIMLVSVTERTREIGVRKAIGARRMDIVIQFLMEAITLTGMGGVLGILVSMLVVALVGLLAPFLQTSVPTWAVVTGFTVSVMIGLFFGVWPAVKASRLDPVEALRYE